ncbi:MAG: SMC-Scp complex subunit ScpB, partial [Gammaproteobacteria bacterium]|nr:SMC-Scp complex subunit ScpB [Gammaproteobacteria bacterium]
MSDDSKKNEINNELQNSDESLNTDDSLSTEDTASTVESQSADGSIPVEDSLPADGSIPVEDSLPADGSSQVEDSLLAEGSQQASNSAINDPDILASLKELSSAQSEVSKPVKVHIHSPESIQHIVEAAIMAASKAISIDKLLSLFPENENVDKNTIRQAIDQLMKDYQTRGVELIEVSSGFRFQVTQNVAPWVSRLWEERPQKYSRALLETLALVAYRQPVTRGEIEEIRGVSVSSQIMRTLVER